MKKIFYLVAIFPLLLEAQIRFSEGTWDQLFERAGAEQKIIFLNAYTTWCEPCQEMEEYVFSDLEVSNFYNARFISVAMDMEDYPGVELSEELQINVFPSFLFLSAKGEVLHRGCGAMDATDFLQMGQEALSKVEALSAYAARYMKGERETGFILQYFEKLDEACMDAERAAKQYLATIELTQLVEETPWEVFASYNWDIYSREFQYLLSNRPTYEQSIGKSQVDAKIYDTFLAQYQEIFEAEELHGFAMRALLHQIKDVGFTGSDTLKLMMNLHYAEYEENWEEYATHAVELVGMSDITDPEQLNELAWKFYLFVDNRRQLEIASSWSKQAVDQEPSPSMIDTYASLQYKLGNKKKAIELEERALALAIELNDDPAHYKYQLQKFKK